MLSRDFMPLSQAGIGNLTPSDLQRTCLRGRTFCFYEFHPFHNREQDNSEICNQQISFSYNQISAVFAIKSNVRNAKPIFPVFVLSFLEKKKIRSINEMLIIDTIESKTIITARTSTLFSQM